MARKNKVPSLPSPALSGAVEADVSVGHLPPYIPGARPAPYLNIRFVNEHGATLSFPMTARTAAVLLRNVNSLLQHTLREFRSLGIGDEKRPATNQFQASYEGPHHAFEGFRSVGCTFADVDQLRGLRELAGLDPAAATTGEFPFIIFDVRRANEESRHVDASLVMDLWATSTFRDELYFALNQSMPDKSPNDRPVQTVDGVVGTIGV